jgi:hypothetical protein
MSGKFGILKMTKVPGDPVVRLLEQNAIGTPGKSIVYRHVNVREKVAGLGDAYFCNLSIREKLIGTICFCKRTVLNPGRRQTAFYIRYFTFLNKFRSNHEQQRRGKQSQIRDDVAMLMDGEGLVYDDDLLLYAYVDDDNIRSKRLIGEFGFREIGSFRTIPFSRFYPKHHRDVTKITDDRKDEMRALLTKFYANYQLVSFENLFLKGDYFVIREGGEIVCGVQAIPDQWEIVDLPGFSGTIMMRVIPGIPLLNRLFQKKYRFVFLEAIYCKSGYEKHFSRLFESVLRYHNAYSATLCLDPKSDLYRSISSLRLGITHKIMGEKSIDIVVKTSRPNLLDDESPFFISGFDVL